MEERMYSTLTGLADPSRRLSHIQKKPKSRLAFFAEAGHDKPIDPMCELCWILVREGRAVFANGRSERRREETQARPARRVSINAVDARPYMRRLGDFRDGAIIKMEPPAQMRADGFEPRLVFDDRDQVVHVWRAAGTPCAQAPANSEGATMSTTEERHAACLRFQQADGDSHLEIARRFGARAGDVRYSPHARGPARSEIESAQRY